MPARAASGVSRVNVGLVGSSTTPATRWLALAFLPALAGCAAVVAVPIVAGGTLWAGHKPHVRAATVSPAKPKRAKRHSSKGTTAPAKAPKVQLTSLKEMPPPSAAPTPAADDPWQRFFAYGFDKSRPEQAAASAGRSALLVANPPLDEPQRRDCAATAPAAVIDLDNGSAAFAPDGLATAPPGVAAGLAHLREAGVVVLWISNLPAARATDVAKALRTSGLDPRGQDQLLLIRNVKDRKQLLREDASADVCIVAIAGDRRSDFDELFDYLRNPASAAGLDAMLGDGWFLVQSLASAPAPSTER